MLHEKFKQNVLLAAQIHVFTTAQIYLELQFCVELHVKKTPVTGDTPGLKGDGCSMNGCNSGEANNNRRWR